MACFKTGLPQAFCAHCQNGLPAIRDAKAFSAGLDLTNPNVIRRQSVARHLADDTSLRKPSAWRKAQEQRDTLDILKRYLKG